MSRKWKVVTIVGLLALSPLLIAAAVKGKEAHHRQEMKQMVEMIKHIYEACDNPDAAVIMAEVGLTHLGKQGKVDSVKELEKILEGTKKQQMRNFTRLALAHALGEKGDHDAAAEQLKKLAEENTAE